MFNYPIFITENNIQRYMGDPKAFMTVPRQEAGYRPVHERIADFSEVEQTLNTSDRKRQA